MPSWQSMRTICGRLSVRVPVLSAIRVRRRDIAPSGFAPLSNTPKCAARGRHSQDQGERRGCTGMAKAWIGSPVNHRAAKAMVAVTARSPRDQRQASRALGAFDACAFTASRTIPAQVLRFASRVTARSKAAPAFADPLMASALRPIRTGKGFALQRQGADEGRSRAMRPSTGTTSPCRIRSRPPRAISSSGTPCSVPLQRRVALRGMRAKRSRVSRRAQGCG